MTVQEQLQEMSYSLRQMAEHLREQAERDRETDKTLMKIELLLTQLNSRPHITREDVLAVLRNAFDEIRQGLLLRAGGLTAERVKDPEPESNGNGGREDSIKFVVKKDGRVVTTFPKLTWRGVWTAMKYFFAIAAAGGSITLIIRAILKAIAGEVE